MNEHPAPIKRTRDLREELAAAEAEIERLKRRPQEHYIVRLCEGCGAAEGFDHAAACPAGYTGIAGAECDPRSADLIGRRLMDLAMERDMADAEIERLNALLDEKTGSVVTLNTQLNALHIEKRTWGKEIKRLEQQPSAKLREAYRAWVKYVDEDGCMVGGSAATVLLRDAFDAGGFEEPPGPMTMEKADEILVKMWEECAASEDSWKVSFRRIVGRQLDYAYKAGQLLAMSEAEQPEPWDAEEIAQETADNLSKEPYMNGVYRRRILAVLNRRYPPPPSQEEREAFIKRLQGEPVLGDDLEAALDELSHESPDDLPKTVTSPRFKVVAAYRAHPIRTVSQVEAPLKEEIEGYDERLRREAAKCGRLREFARLTCDTMSDLRAERDRARDEAVERIAEWADDEDSLGIVFARQLKKAHARGELFGDPETSGRVKCERCSEPGLAVYHPSGECLGRSESMLDELPEGWEWACESFYDGYDARHEAGCTIHGEDAASVIRDAKRRSAEWTKADAQGQRLENRVSVLSDRAQVHGRRINTAIARIETLEKLVHTSRAELDRAREALDDRISDLEDQS